MRPGDSSWSEGSARPALQLAVATFGILSLELALIRWAGGQMRAFAYFANVVLLAAFLGMGLGLALGRRHPGLVHLTLPCLVLVAAVLGLSEPLGLLHLTFPDPSVHLWGSEMPSSSAGGALTNYAIFGGVTAAIVACFVFAGSAVGWLFPKLPSLHAYRWDLLGSLVGVGAVTAITATGAGPVAWLLPGVLAFAWLSRRPASLVSAAAVLALGAVSVRGALFSPYNRIDLAEQADGLVLMVNRDFHQYIHDLSPRRLESGPRPDTARALAAVYELPFAVNERRGSALVVGAGTGNDAAAALRRGYARVVSVDIDPVIVALGRARHPERPYADPRSQVVVDDARAYFERSRDTRFDAVVFGLLDSHAMFAALSTLRLDNYVYTEEGLRSAWEHVAPGGHLSVSFSLMAGPWLFDRLYWTLQRATGREPVALFHGVHHGCTFLVPRDDARLALDAVAYERLKPYRPARGVRNTTDDWPFLYVRPGVFPWGYVVVLGGLLLLAWGGTRAAFGRGALGADFDPVMFLMGAGFLLIETRGVTAFSLLFGSTWVVNSAVFGGVLAMALVANEAVARRQPAGLMPWFCALFASVALLWAVPASALVGLPLVARGVAGGLLNALPVGLAGVIVSMLLARSRNSAAALGSNLLGAVVGGCLEYLSMLVGMRALSLLALALYLGAALAHGRRGGTRQAPA